LVSCELHVVDILKGLDRVFLVAWKSLVIILVFLNIQDFLLINDGVHVVNMLILLGIVVICICGLIFRDAIIAFVTKGHLRLLNRIWCRSLTSRNLVAVFSKANLGIFLVLILICQLLL
jgi:hypothetical protein